MNAMLTTLGCAISICCSLTVLAGDIDSVNTGSVPEFTDLAGSFLVKKNASTVPDSHVMECFLGGFTQHYRSQFTESDAEKIEAHWANWLTDLRVLYNASNAHGYRVLFQFDGLTESDFDVDTLHRYADALDQLEREHEARIMAHHQRLADSLSQEGAARLQALLDTRVKADIRDAFARGGMGGSWFDMQAFIDAHPDIMAKQAALECALAREQGPPKELIYAQIFEEIEGRDAQIGILELVPKVAR